MKTPVSFTLLLSLCCMARGTPSDQELIKALPPELQEQIAEEGNPFESLQMRPLPSPAPPAVRIDGEGVDLPPETRTFPANTALLVRSMEQPARPALLRPVTIVPVAEEIPLARQQEIREDLRTMMLLIERAVFPAGPQGGGELARIAAGAQQDSAPRIQALWMEPGGALIIVRVPWLLQAPGGTPPAAVPAPSSAWESARRELNGGPPPAAEAPSAPWQPEKVAALNQVLEQILPHAANIRGLDAPKQLLLLVDSSAEIPGGSGGQIRKRFSRGTAKNSTPPQAGTASAEPRPADASGATSAPVVPDAPVVESKEDIPFGTKVVGKPGMVYSPHAPDKGQVDVRGLAPGTKVQCPYTGKKFRVP